MTFAVKILLTAASLALCACVQPAPQPVIKSSGQAEISSNVTPKPAAPKKTPRMNGRGKVSSISLTDGFALQQSDKVLIYDARPGYMYLISHIPGAKNLTKTDCDSQITAREPEIKAALAAGKTIIVYCTNMMCADARTVATHLASFGYSSSVLQGGWDSWKESGLPTE